MEIKDELQKCNTAGEMLELLNRRYHLDQKLGPLVKAAFIKGLTMAIQMIKPPLKF